jgi:hypothetical protein
MNERIQELAQQAQQYAEYVTPQGCEWFDTFKEKFAELIVKECTDVLLEWKKEPFPLDPDFAASLIKEHFGVEK